MFAIHVAVFSLLIMTAMVLLQQARAQILDKCELAIALDHSTSMTEDQFTDIKKFVVNVTSNFTNFGTDEGVRLAVLKFSTESFIEFNLTTYTTIAAAIAHVRGIVYEGGITNTHLAVAHLQLQLSKGRPGANKAGLIITDGNADDLDKTKKAVDKFKAAGYTMIIIGIGTTINEDALKPLASKPELYFPVANFADLSNITDKMLGVVCAPPPTTTTTPPPPPPQSGICDRCKYTNGIYLFSDLKYCYMYHRCIGPGQKFPLDQPCEFGQFFDPQDVACKRAGDVNCDIDPCKSGKAGYPDHVVCSGYWECDNRRTLRAKCCKRKFRYVEGQGCVSDPSCDVACPPTQKTYPCVLKVNPDKAAGYLENIGPDVWEKRDCAPGTEFNSSDCQCSNFGKIAAVVCQNIIYIPYDKSVQDVRRRVYVTNPRPKVRARVVVPGGTNGVGRFNGNNRLYITQFANWWWGNKVLIRLRFQETARTQALPSGTLENIFGNGDCRKDSSIGLKYDRANNRVIGKVVTRDLAGNENTKTVTVNVGSGNWKDVEFKYDGVELKLTVNGVVQTTPASGDVAVRHAALQIGAGCVPGANYVGYQDEFYVFPCLP